MIDVGTTRKRRRRFSPRIETTEYVVKGISSILFEDPLIKATILGMFTLVGNVLAGSYIFEITRNNGPNTYLAWGDSLHSPSFLGLAALLLTLGIYGWRAAKHEGTVKRHLETLTDADIRARAYEVLLEPTLNAVKKEIEQGKVRPMNEVLVLLGLDKTANK
jgi:hypothetical protein